MQLLLVVLVVSIRLVAPSSPAWAAIHQLRVLTYNIWGLPKPAEHAPWRYAEIARRLSPYDVVALQETWSRKTKVIHATNTTHPYRAFGKRPHSLLWGSGLVALSRFPIVESRFRAFRACSEWDCLSRKGVLMFRVAVAPGVEVDFYQTHLNAWEDKSLVRSAQILELVGMVYDHSHDRPVVILGDINSDYRSVNYLEVIGGLLVEDAYRKHVARLPTPTPAQRLGYTFDVFHNPWADPRLSGETRPQVLDYVFFRDTNRARIDVIDASLAFTEPVRGDKPLSDHYAVDATLGIEDFHSP